MFFLGHLVWTHILLPSEYERQYNTQTCNTIRHAYASQSIKRTGLALPSTRPYRVNLPANVTYQLPLNDKAIERSFNLSMAPAIWLNRTEETARYSLATASSRQTAYS
jgi:hypothetical protein